MATFKGSSADYIGIGTVGLIAGAALIGLGLTAELDNVDAELVLGVLGYVVAAIGLAVLLVGLVAQGVKVGMRDSQVELSHDEAARETGS